VSVTPKDCRNQRRGRHSTGTDWTIRANREEAPRPAKVRPCWGTFARSSRQAPACTAHVHGEPPQPRSMKSRASRLRTEPFDSRPVSRAGTDENFAQGEARPRRRDANGPLFVRRRERTSGALSRRRRWDRRRTRSGVRAGVTARDSHSVWRRSRCRPAPCLLPNPPASAVGHCGPCDGYCHDRAAVGCFCRANHPFQIGLLPRQSAIEAVKVSWKAALRLPNFHSPCAGRVVPPAAAIAPRSCVGLSVPSAPQRTSNRLKPSTDAAILSRSLDHSQQR
jgi:hypothetical protein